MADVLLVLVVLLALVGAASVAAIIVVLHAITVRNRVVPNRPTTAPMSWLVAPDLAARLHRRARAAMSLASAAGGGSGVDLGLDEVVVQLQERAVELDAQLVIASRSPKTARRRMLRELQSEVAELERLAERTVRMTRAWSGRAPSEQGLSAVRERLELLEGALHELDGLDMTVAGRAQPVTQKRSTR